MVQYMVKEKKEIDGRRESGYFIHLIVGNVMYREDNEVICGPDEQVDIESPVLCRSLL